MDVKLGSAVLNFFCVFFKTVLQITAKHAICLNEYITKQFVLAQNNFVTDKGIVMKFGTLLHITWVNVDLKFG